jgi:hypothetical protein
MCFLLGLWANTHFDSTSTSARKRRDSSARALGIAASFSRFTATGAPCSAPENTSPVAPLPSSAPNLREGKGTRLMPAILRASSAQRAQPGATHGGGYRRPPAPHWQRPAHCQRPPLSLGAAANWRAAAAAPESGRRAGRQPPGPGVSVAARLRPLVAALAAQRARKLPGKAGSTDTDRVLEALKLIVYPSASTAQPQCPRWTPRAASHSPFPPGP